MCETKPDRMREIKALAGCADDVRRDINQMVLSGDSMAVVVSLTIAGRHMQDAIESLNTAASLAEKESARRVVPEKKEARRARVAWQNITTGETGHGEYTDSSIAQAWCDSGNKDCTFIKHWIEYEPVAPETGEVNHENQS